MGIESMIGGVGAPVVRAWGVAIKVYLNLPNPTFL